MGCVFKILGEDKNGAGMVRSFVTGGRLFAVEPSRFEARAAALGVDRPTLQPRRTAKQDGTSSALRPGALGCAKIGGGGAGAKLNAKPNT